MVSANAAEVDALYAGALRRMVESGEWDRLRAALTAKLSESGFTDEFKHRTKERARNMNPLSFSALLAEISPNAQGSVPLSVRRDMIAMIKASLDKHFE